MKRPNRNTGTPPSCPRVLIDWHNPPPGTPQRVSYRVINVEPDHRQEQPTATATVTAEREDWSRTVQKWYWHPIGQP